MTAYLVYDVFTDTRFGGNPLAVIPDATALPEADLQRIAREFNFSETTFVYPPEDPQHHARVRIFTPTMEVPFAGHPTIGTALALHDIGRVPDSLTFELGVGPIPVTVRNGTARFTTRVPLQTWPGPSVDVVAESVGLSQDQIRTDRHAPTIASVGLPFALAELTDANALQAALANTEAFRAFDPSWPADTHYDLLVYTRDGAQIEARMFAPLDGIPEDPATGSAAAALASFLGHLEERSATFVITQGVTMGRPSQIKAEVTVENGTPIEVAISGRAVKVMEGKLTA
ncbi:MAG: PhzF family phenazine biosynthesis protein [Pseudomonadota bacterium]